MMNLSSHEWKYSIWTRVMYSALIFLSSVFYTFFKIDFYPKSDQSTDISIFVWFQSNSFFLVLTISNDRMIKLTQVIDFDFILLTKNVLTCWNVFHWQFNSVAWFFIPTWMIKKLMSTNIQTRNYSQIIHLWFAQFMVFKWFGIRNIWSNKRIFELIYNNI